MTKNVPESEIAIALGQFGAAEAKLEKLERIFGELCDLTPDGIVFGGDSQYEDLCRDYEDVLAALPEIDGWKPKSQPIDQNSLAHSRLDAAEIGEPTALFYVQETVEAPSPHFSNPPWDLSSGAAERGRWRRLGDVGTVWTGVDRLTSPVDRKSRHERGHGRAETCCGGSGRIGGGLPGSAIAGRRVPGRHRRARTRCARESPRPWRT